MTEIRFHRYQILVHTSTSTFSCFLTLFDRIRSISCYSIILAFNEITTEILIYMYQSRNQTLYTWRSTCSTFRNAASENHSHGVVTKTSVKWVHHEFPDADCIGHTDRLMIAQMKNMSTPPTRQYAIFDTYQLEVSTSLRRRDTDDWLACSTEKFNDLLTILSGV